MPCCNAIYGGPELPYESAMGRRMRGWQIFALGLMAAVPARAADMPLKANPAPVTQDYWTVTVGAEGRILPDFLGSDTYVFAPFPLINVRKPGSPEPLFAYRDGLDYTLYENGPIQIGPVAQFHFGRTRKLATASQGLRNVDDAIEIGVFGEYWFQPWLRSRLELRQGVSGHNGEVADLSADAIWQATPKLRFFAGPRMTFATDDANEPYFSITPWQSFRSGLPVYSAGGGLRSIGAGAQVRYKWDAAWGTHAYVEYDRLEGTVSDAPLVRLRGSPNQLVLGLGTTYAFDMKAWW